MDIVRFVNPDMLWLSALIVPMVAYYVYRMRQGGATMRISTIDGVRRVPRTAKYYLRHLPLVLCCLAVALLSVALARPQSAEHNSNSTTEGIDIVLSLDVSGSMLAAILPPTASARPKRWPRILSWTVPTTVSGWWCSRERVSPSVR